MSPGDGPDPAALAYASFVRDFGPINLTTISETTNAETARRARRCAGPICSPSSTTPTSGSSPRSRTTTSRAERQNRVRSSPSACCIPTVTPLIESAADALAVTLHETGVVDLDRIAELSAARARNASPNSASASISIPKLPIARHRDVWETADAYLSGQIRTKLAAADRRGGPRPALSAQCRRARKGPARGSEALRHHRPPRRAVDPRRRRRRLLRGSPRRQNPRLSHGRNRQLVDQCPRLRARRAAPRPIGARPAATPANC